MDLLGFDLARDKTCYYPVLSYQRMLKAIIFDKAEMSLQQIKIVVPEMSNKEEVL